MTNRSTECPSVCCTTINISNLKRSDGVSASRRYCIKERSLLLFMPSGCLLNTTVFCPSLTACVMSRHYTCCQRWKPVVVFYSHSQSRLPSMTQWLLQQAYYHVVWAWNKKAEPGWQSPSFKALCWVKLGSNFRSFKNRFWNWVTSHKEKLHSQFSLKS